MECDLLVMMKYGVLTPDTVLMALVRLGYEVQEAQAKIAYTLAERTWKPYEEEPER